MSADQKRIINLMQSTSTETAVAPIQSEVVAPFLQSPNQSSTTIILRGKVMFCDFQSLFFFSEQLSVKPATELLQLALSWSSLET